MSDFSAQLDDYLSLHAFSREQSFALHQIHEGDQKDYEILPPWELSASASEISLVDLKLLELSFFARPFSDFPMIEEVADLLKQLEVTINEGFFAFHNIYIESSLSYEQISEKGFDVIHNILMDLTEKVQAKVYIRLSAASPIIKVEKINCDVDVPDKIGALEYARASLEAVLGPGSAYSCGEGLRVVVAPGGSEPLLKKIAACNLSIPLEIVEKVGSEFRKRAVDKLAVLESGAALSGIPAFIKAVLDEEGISPVLAINPSDFFSGLESFVAKPASFKSGFVANDNWWATGETSALHDDAWSFKCKKEDIVVSLARPDPSFYIPVGGVFDTVAALIQKNYYFSNRHCLLPMLPPGLTRNYLSLSASDYRPSLILRMTLSSDGEIKDVDVESASLKIGRVIEDSALFPIDETTERVLDFLRARYGWEKQQLMGVQDMVKACVILSQEAACIFAENNGFPILYQNRRLKDPAERLASLEHCKEDLEPEIYQALIETIEDEEGLKQIVKQHPLVMIGFIEFRMSQKIYYSRTKPQSSFFVYDKVIGSFGPPLRQYIAMSTIMSWSRLLRGESALELRPNNVSTILRDILFAGVYSGESVFSDPNRYKVTNDAIRLLEIDGAPKIRVQDIDSGTRIKGICREDGRLVLG